MTISSEVSRNDYVGNGATSVYSYTFKILLASDLKVVVQNTAGVESLLVLNVDYGVSGAGDEAGGTITLLAGNLTSGYKLAIRRDVPLTQLADIGNQGPFLPEIHEDAFDKAAMADIQQQEQIDRSIKLPDSEIGATDKITLPTVVNRANKFLAFDSDGKVIGSAGGINPAIPVSSYIQTLLDDANIAAALTTLGVSGFIQTLLDDASAAAARTTLGAADDTAVVKKDGSVPMTGDLQMGNHKVTGVAKAIADGQAVPYDQAKPLWQYKRPVLKYVSASTVDAEANTGTASERAIVFPDGDYRIVTSSTLYRFDITRNAVLSGTKQSGLRTSLSEAADTWYALYAVKATDNATDWVLVGDTVLPIQANFATLNSNFGTKGWRFLGMIRNGDSQSFSNDIVPFVMAGNVTTFTNNASSTPGILFATGNDPQSYGYLAGTGDLQIPDNISHIIWGTRVNATSGLTDWDIGDSANTYFVGRFALNGTTFNGHYRHLGTATDGCRVNANGAVATAFIFVSGFIDAVLGVDSNPMF